MNMKKILGGFIAVAVVLSAVSKPAAADITFESPWANTVLETMRAYGGVTPAVPAAPPPRVHTHEDEQVGTYVGNHKITKAYLMRNSVNSDFFYCYEFADGDELPHCYSFRLESTAHAEDGKHAEEDGKIQNRKITKAFRFHDSSDGFAYCFEYAVGADVTLPVAKVALNLCRNTQFSYRLMDGTDGFAHCYQFPLEANVSNPVGQARLDKCVPASGSDLTTMTPPQLTSPSESGDTLTDKNVSEEGAAHGGLRERSGATQIRI